MDTLRCSKCGNEKDSDDFYPRNLRCKQCCIDHQIEYQAARRERGICATCPGETAPGRSKCSACLQAIKDLKAKRKAEGLCSVCGAVQTPGKSYCRVCYERSQASNVSKAIRKHKGKPCIDCQGTTNQHIKRCDRCQEEWRTVGSKLYAKQQRNERIQAGLCVECGQEPCLPGRQQGLICNQKSRERGNKVAHERLNGHCVHCGEPAMDDLPRCSECETRYQKRGVHRRFVRACAVCGYATLSVVQVHHINGEHDDNRPENLVPLCPTHHVEVEQGLIPCPKSFYISKREQPSLWEAALLRG